LSLALLAAEDAAVVLTAHSGRLRGGGSPHAARRRYARRDQGSALERRPALRRAALRVLHIRLLER
jgi:hypothetical protein